MIFVSMAKNLEKEQHMKTPYGEANNENQNRN